MPKRHYTAKPRPDETNDLKNWLKQKENQEDQGLSKYNSHFLKIFKPILNEYNVYMAAIYYLTIDKQLQVANYTLFHSITRQRRLLYYTTYTIRHKRVTADDAAILNKTAKQMQERIDRIRRIVELNVEYTPMYLPFHELNIPEKLDGLLQFDNDGELPSLWSKDENITKTAKQLFQPIKDLIETYMAEHQTEIDAYMNSEEIMKARERFEQNARRRKNDREDHRAATLQSLHEQDLDAQKIAFYHRFHQIETRYENLLCDPDRRAIRSECYGNISAIYILSDTPKQNLGRFNGDLTCLSEKAKYLRADATHTHLTFTTDPGEAKQWRSRGGADNFLKKHKELGSNWCIIAL